MKRGYGWICLMLVLALICPTAYAAGAASDIRLNQVQQSRDTLTMYVSLIDDGGNPIQGDFSADEFTVQVDSSVFPVENVTAFDPETMGINYMLCIDISKSLTKEMMANVHEGVNAFVDGLGPMDTVSVLTFGSTVEEKTRMNGNREQIKEIVNAIDRTDNNTALYKGVLDAVEIASKINGRTTVIVITDGENDVETADESVKDYTKDNIYDSVTAAQVPLYCVGLTEGKTLDRESLRELADATGGDQFFAPSSEVWASMNMIQQIMRSTYMLRVKPVNNEGRAGFEELTTFVVGYEPNDAPFVSSNKLQQEINWSSIPAPITTPDSTVVPEIGLDLDDAQITYRDGGKVTISGLIEVQQGSVDKDELTILVNDKPWVAELNRNGDDYVFVANGTILENTTELVVSAIIQGTDITSRQRSVSVATPTPAATSTPKPSLSLTLDPIDQSLLFEPGRVITLTGVVEAKSSPVNVDDLVLFINAVPCETEDAQFSDIGGNQYEFSANYRIEPGSSTTLDVFVQVSGSDITSRKQRVYMPTPAPTPEPKLTLTLDDTHILFEPGAEVTFSGTIEAEGEVDMNDIGVYVEGTLWNNTIIEQLDDGSFRFETKGQLSDGLAAATVRASLISAQNIRSAQEKMELWSPTPVITPTPTPKPVQTPPPSPTPTASPTPVPGPTATPDNSIGAKVGEVIRSLQDSGRLWIVIAAAGVLLLLIIVLIVLLIVRAKKKPHPEDNFNMSVRHPDPDVGGTVRPDMTDNSASLGGTVGPEGSGNTVGTQSSAGTVGTERASNYGEEQSRKRSDGTFKMSGARGGTIDVERDVELNGTIMYLDENSSNVHEDEGKYAARFEDEREPSGTMRLTYDDEVEPSGTMRLTNDDYDNEPILEIRMEQRYRREQREERSCEMTRGQTKVIGRIASVDIPIDDVAVSSRHCQLYFDGVDLFLEDLNSTNGTRINGESEKMEPGEMRRLTDGDELHIGKTVLTLHFGEPRLG